MGGATGVASGEASHTQPPRFCDGCPPGWGVIRRLAISTSIHPPQGTIKTTLPRNAEPRPARFCCKAPRHELSSAAPEDGKRTTPRRT